MSAEFAFVINTLPHPLFLNYNQLFLFYDLHTFKNDVWKYCDPWTCGNDENIWRGTFKEITIIGSKD